MTQSSHPNLYNQLFDDILIADTLLDIGCGYLLDLIDFEYSQFKRIEGLDKNIQQPFLLYKKIKNKTHTHELYQYFRTRFIILKIDLKDYNFEVANKSLIICNKVLHFYDDKEKMIFLDIFHDSLQKDGLLYVKLNHNKHADNIDPSYMTEIHKNVFQNKEHPEDIRYLVESAEFLQIIRSKFSLIERHTLVDDKTVSFVIRR